MKKLIIFVLLSFYYSLSLFSQGYRYELPVGHHKIVLIDSRPNLDGSPYLSEDWQKGSILMKNGDTIVSIPLRYNVFKDEMQFQNEDKAYAIGSPDSIKKLMLGDLSFVYLGYNEDKKLKKGFFEELSKGSACLLQHHYPVILPANYNVALNVGNKNDQLSLKKKFFLKKDNNVIEIDKKGKNFVSAFNLKGKDIQKYVKDNNLSFNKETDLIQITNFANAHNL